MKNIFRSIFLLLCYITLSGAQAPDQGLDFEQGRQIGTVDLDEISGIADSHRNTGIFYVHNDSGGGNFVYAINESGRIVQTFELQNAPDRDYEDISVALDPQTRVPHVYLADLGNNAEAEITMNIYRFPEPSITAGQAARNVDQTVTSYRVRYSESGHDTESVFVDPANSDMYLLTKRDNPSEIYGLQWPLSTSSINTPQFLGDMQVTNLTAADITPDGKQIIARTVSRIYGWNRRDGESIADALKRTPVQLPYRGNEPKGEAIAWDYDNAGYYTTTERDGGNAPISFYERRPSGNAPVIQGPSSASGEVGTPFTYQIRVNNDPDTIEVQNTLPNGLRFDAATARILGTPTRDGQWTVTLRAENQYGFDTASLTIRIADRQLAPEIRSSSTAAGTVGRSFNYQISAINDPDEFDLVGTLPAGLNFTASTGRITGVPTTAERRTVTLKASNEAGEDTQSLTITIADAVQRPTITSANLVDARLGASVNYLITATEDPTEFAVTGSLPDGLVFNSATRRITGTPERVGTRYVTLRATNAAGQGTLRLKINVASAAPVLYSNAKLEGTMGSRFSQSFTARNYPARHRIVSGALPPGISLDELSGFASGTPTTVGTWTVTVRASNSIGSDTETYTITINAKRPEINSAYEAIGVLNQRLTHYVRAANGPKTFSVEGQLPPGITFSSSGRFSGIPTQLGYWSVRVTASNDHGSDTRNLTLGVVREGVPIFTNGHIVKGDISGDFRFQLRTRPQATLYSIDEDGEPDENRLPSNLSLNPQTGLITGRVRGTGIYKLRFIASNDAGMSIQLLTFIIEFKAPGLGGQVDLKGVVDQPFRHQLQTTNPADRFRWSGARPSGISLDSDTGLITGTARTKGKWTFTVYAQNEHGISNLEYTIEITDPAPVINSPNTASGVVNEFLSYQITAENNPTGYGLSGIRPPGLSFSSSTGRLSGRPSQAGTWDLTMSARNAGGNDSEPLRVTIDEANEPFEITNPDSASFVALQTISYRIRTSSPADRWGVNGTLPVGLSVDERTGEIKGQPAQLGTFSVYLQAKSGNQVDQKRLNLTITDPGTPMTAVVTSPSVAAGYVNQPFYSNLAAANNPTGFSLLSDLPQGLTLNGRFIRGTATEAGQQRVRYSVSHATGGSSTSYLDIHINRPGAGFHLPYSNSFSSRYNHAGWGYGMGGRVQLQNYSLRLDGGFRDRDEAMNKAIVTLDLGAHDDIKIRLAFSNLNGDEADPVPEVHTSFDKGDAVSISTDGRTWYRLIDLSQYRGYGSAQVSISELAARHNLTLSPRTRLQFSHYDATPDPYQGFAFHSMVVEGTARPQANSINALAKRSVSATPQGGNTFQIAADSGQAEFTMPKGYDSVLVTGVTFGATVTDITDPESPIRLKAPVLQAESELSLYFSVTPGTRVRID